MSKFHEELESKELEVEYKQAEILSLTLVLYMASIDRTLQKHLVSMGAFDNTQEEGTVKTINEENIEEYIESLG